MLSPLRLSSWTVLVLAIVIASSAVAQSPSQPAPTLVGTWRVEDRLGGSTLRAVITFQEREGKLEGTYRCMGRSAPITAITLEDGRVTFDRAIGSEVVRFTGRLSGHDLTGVAKASFGEFRLEAKRYRKKHVF